MTNKLPETNEDPVDDAKKGKANTRYLGGVQQPFLGCLTRVIDWGKASKKDAAFSNQYRGEVTVQMSAPKQNREGKKGRPVDLAPRKALPRRNAYEDR